MRRRWRGRGKPIDWQGETKRPQRGTLILGLSILLFGAAMIGGSFFVWDFLERWEGSILVMGDPAAPLRIVGGIFAIVGVLVFWVGLPRRD